MYESGEKSLVGWAFGGVAYSGCGMNLNWRYFW